ncbi:MAG: hypothetical protein OCC49_11725 [Fibrobacterales bacterium]
MIISQHRTLLVTLFMLLPLISTHCVFKTSVEPTELEGGLPLDGYYTAAELDNERIYHNRDDSISINLKGLFIYSDCSLQSITLDSVTTGTTFKMRYKVALTTPSSLTCANSTGTYDTILTLENLWGNNATELKIYKYTDLPIEEVNDKALDSILLRKGTYNNYTVSFEFDSIFRFTNDPSSHTTYTLPKSLEGLSADQIDRDTITPKLSTGILIEYPYQPFVIKEDTVDFFQSRCIDLSNTRDCDTIPTFVKKSYIDTLRDTTHLFSNVTKEIHQYMCIDSITQEFKLDDDGEPFSICANAGLRDTTRIGNLTLADTINSSHTILFYEQCIKEEEIICSTIDTVLIQSFSLPDTAIEVPIIQDSIVITEKTGCIDGQTYCSGETTIYNTILDTIVPDTTFYRSVAYLQAINHCDSINSFNINRFDYKARGGVIIAFETFSMADTLLCPFDPLDIDTLVWDIDHFKKQVDSSFTHEVGSDSYDLLDSILMEFNRP